MINSFYIENFKCFKELFIPTLGNVNLIIGKNNAGKSSLLEALMIYASGGNEATLRQISIKHGEKYRGFIQNELTTSDLQIDINSFNELYPYEHLVFGRSFHTGNIVIGRDAEDPDRIIFNTIIQNSFDENKINYDLINGLQGLNLSEEEIKNSYKKYYLNGDLFTEWIAPILTIRKGSNTAFINLSSPATVIEQRGFYKLKNLNYNFVGCNQDNINSLGLLWDRITLTAKEPVLIEALRLIDKNIIDLRFIGDNNERNVIVRFRDNSIYPLKSMGDGIIRILDIILNTFAAENGFLLIDELDNGLHYSVQKSLWEIIFNLSKILNIQVFATTHSWDCIQSFSEIASESHDSKGVLLKIGTSKLSKSKGQPIVTVYNEEKLQYITEQMVEVR